MVQVFGLLVMLCVVSYSLAIQGSTESNFPGSTPTPERSPSPLFPPKNYGAVPSLWKPWDPPIPVKSPVPVISPASSLKPNEQPQLSAPESGQPNSQWKKATVDNVPLHATSPDTPTSPAWPISSPPVKVEPPSVLPEPIAIPILPPAPSTSYEAAAAPVSGLLNHNTHNYATVRHPPIEAPMLSNPKWHFNGAPAPHWFSKSIPGLRSSSHHHQAKNSGSPLSAPPIPLSNNHYSPIPSTGQQAKTPQIPTMPLSPQFQILPPPPPQKDCAPLVCTEPLTYGPPEWPCVCVLPIQVGLRLTVALYTFFPLVSVLASEIAAGVFMKQSQVRIMGANAAGDNPEETIVLIDLLPLDERFDDTTAYITFKRFWSKEVAIQPSFFGDFNVLYVRYPGLPPSPPLGLSVSGIIPSQPYSGHDNNGSAMKPLGVDISKNLHKHWLSRSMMSIIILSCTVALLLLSGVLWALVLRYGQCGSRSDPNPPTAICSLPKPSGLSLSMVGSGTNSPSFSLGSSVAAYRGSAKTFSSSYIEKATDFFNETRILGEGGFGRVYSGALEDGTEVAIKILKRYDQQGSREFLAEVEMLSRLHHRNLVKLIGICVEDRTRCLVYELVPNGSVESHLHGIDKENSPLDWSSRLKIALGAARALAYLHEDSSPRVIHRDFKASNILLEDDFTPKVSDFGLARAAFDEANRHISTRVMGTFGYVAPEYAMTGHLLVKSDVYSYGVVLLELLTGRKPVDMSQPPGQENLGSWARPLLTTREGLDSIIDPSLGPNFPHDSISKVAAIASMCVQPEVSNRPFMGEVVQALKMVCNERDGTNDSPSRSCISQADFSMVMDDGEITNSGRLAAALITPCSDAYYDYHRDLSLSSELLRCSKLEAQDSESFRRHSSSGPLRTSKGKALWESMRKMYRGSVSEHRLLFKFWPGSH